MSTQERVAYNTEWRNVLSMAARLTLRLEALVAAAGVDDPQYVEAMVELGRCHGLIKKIAVDLRQAEGRGLVIN